METQTTPTAISKTYHGSCHCGRVRFSAELDLQAGTGRCNCTICAKVRRWGAIIKPAAFRLVAGRAELSDYRRDPGGNHDYFCRHCGVRVFAEGVLEAIGGAYVSVNVAALDDASVEELASSPIQYFDGRNNNWWNRPSETRHL